MRLVTIMIVAVVPGCAPAHQAPASANRTMERPENDATKESREQTLEWLRKLPPTYVGPPNEEYERMSKIHRQFDFAGWVAEGKAIKGSEGSLIAMIDKGDSLPPDVDVGDIIFALGHIGGAAAVGTLMDCLKGDNSVLRMKSAESLGTLGDPSAVEALGTRLICDAEEVEVQLAIVNALALIGTEPAIAYLKRAADEGDEFVANEARQELDDLEKRGNSTE